jgi:hypothetical protein
MNTSNSIDTNGQSVGTPSDDSNFPFTDAQQYGPSYWEVFADHYAQASYYPQYEEDTAHNWCPAYWAKGCDGRASRMTLAASVMVFDIPEHDTESIEGWLFINMLTGMSHPLPLDEHRIPHCRVILSLDRPVSTRTYTVLRNRIANEVFKGTPSPIHADCRTFCDFPDLTGGTKLMRHDGNALHVDGALALPSMSGTALGCVSDLDAQLRWENDQ